MGRGVGMGKRGVRRRWYRMEGGWVPEGKANIDRWLLPKLHPDFERYFIALRSGLTVPEIHAKIREITQIIKDELSLSELAALAEVASKAGHKDKVIYVLFVDEDSSTPLFVHLPTRSWLNVRQKVIELNRMPDVTHFVKSPRVFCELASLGEEGAGAEQAACNVVPA